VLIRHADSRTIGAWASSRTVALTYMANVRLGPWRPRSRRWRRASTASCRARNWSILAVPRHRRVRRGVLIHEVTLAPDEITTERGIPVTTPVRTLLDLAEVLTPNQLERAVHETEYRRLTSPLAPSMPCSHDIADAGGQRR